LGDEGSEVPIVRMAGLAVFVDGVRTPFGKAGHNGMYAETRADEVLEQVGDHRPTLQLHG